MDTTGGFTLSWGSCPAEGCWMCWLCGSPEHLKELFPTHCSTAKSLSCLTAFPDGLSLIPLITQCRADRTGEQRPLWLLLSQTSECPMQNHNTSRPDCWLLSELSVLSLAPVVLLGSFFWASTPSAHHTSLPHTVISCRFIWRVRGEWRCLKCEQL